MGLTLEVPFSCAGCYSTVKESSLPYYLTIAVGRITGCIPFSRELA